MIRNPRLRRASTTRRFESSRFNSRRRRPLRYLEGRRMREDEMTWSLDEGAELAEEIKSALADFPRLLKSLKEDLASVSSKAKAGGAKTADVKALREIKKGLDDALKSLGKASVVGYNLA